NRAPEQRADHEVQLWETAVGLEVLRQIEATRLHPPFWASIPVPYGPTLGVKGGYELASDALHKVARFSSASLITPTSKKSDSRAQPLTTLPEGCKDPLEENDFADVRDNTAFDKGPFVFRHHVPASGPGKYRIGLLGSKTQAETKALHIVSIADGCKF